MESVVEKLVEGDGLSAARTGSPTAQSAHEGVALVAILGADDPELAVGTLVDGVVLAGTRNGQIGCGDFGLMAEAPRLLTATVAAGLAGPAGRQRSATHRATWWYGTVTRRHGGLR